MMRSAPSSATSRARSTPRSAFVLLGFLALFAFFDLIRELADLGKVDYQLRQVFTFVLLSLPTHAYELFPVVVLIGTLYVLAHLASNSEYTVMRASGLSPRARRAGAGEDRHRVRGAHLRDRRMGRALGRGAGAEGEAARDELDDRPGPRVGAVVQGRGLVHQRARGAPDQPALRRAHLRLRRRLPPAQDHARGARGVRRHAAYGACTTWRRRASRSEGPRTAAPGGAGVALARQPRHARRADRAARAHVGLGAAQVHRAPRRQPAEDRALRDRAVEEDLLPGRRRW